MPLLLVARVGANLLGCARTWQVPLSTFIVWLSPPPRDEKKVIKPDLPAEWIRLYDQVAQVRSCGPLNLSSVRAMCSQWNKLEQPYLTQSPAPFFNKLHLGQPSNPLLQLLVRKAPVLPCSLRRCCCVSPFCAQELDFYKPKGPAHHLDLYHMGLGAAALLG